MTNNNQHPITPPPELVQQWAGMSPKNDAVQQNWIEIATQAARWGADQELEACCEWMANRYGDESHAMGLLCAARRPKPDLNEIKLTSGKEIIRITPTGFHYGEQLIEDAGECHRLLVDFLRRAMPDTDWKHAND